VESLVWNLHERALSIASNGKEGLTGLSEKPLRTWEAPAAPLCRGRRPAGRLTARATLSTRWRAVAWSKGGTFEAVHSLIWQERSRLF
jgi:hypothetical protein